MLSAGQHGLNNMSGGHFLAPAAYLLVAEVLVLALQALPPSGFWLF